ncbi:ABC transporter ATP-binding protein [Hyella patelloides LEGE 07179]|uniref:ABC transporter ATP-binding protein n=1 Tax=Hyella patelloides LEGE 07179 TaxID=945734 RepID=A0A563VXN9_9CYAN|nr:peptidase domain-containing ABC transporter [Hyella patelloides]VEP16157.1 ABC transporter ATP-binding protein [Hyella patelloides LEGE 07179]
MKKYPLVLQHSQEDCGAACLVSVAKYYGRTFTLNRTREAIGTGQLGTSLLGLRRGAEMLGFHGRSAAASPEILDRLSEIPLPAIIHWRGKHWTVLYGKKDNQFIVADPAVGIRYLKLKELTEYWNDWVILLLQPDRSRFDTLADDEIKGIGQFLRRLLPYRNLLLEALVCVCLIGLLSLVSPFFLQILTDDVLIQGNIGLLRGILMAVFIMYLLRGGLSLVADNLIANFARRVELDLILEFGRQILRLPLNYYETRRSGEVVSRLRDIEEINRLISEVVINLPSSILVAIVSLILMLFYSWQLSIVALIVAVVMTLSTIALQPFLQQQTRRAMVLETETQGVLVEAFKGALTLKTTGAAPQFWDEIQSRFGRLANLMFKTTQIGIINSTFSELVADFGNTILLGLGGWLVIQRELSIGQFLAFISLNRNITGLIDEMVDVVADFIRARTANTRLQEIITATPETNNDIQKPWAKIAHNVDITCEQLNFYYPGRIELLKGFSLTIPGGKAIAMIGKSGCGKSTVMKIVAGLYPIESGNIRFGDYNAQDLPLDCIRQQVLLVPQDAHFWSRSILANFRMGNPHLSFEQIVQACKITGADDFIRKLPEKYQTILGEFGSNLSGGQRQRLALSRSLVNDPPILILDESTAGLDPISEAEVLDKLLWHRQGKTTILISHRPPVVNLADWIIYLEKGKTTLQGTQQELRSHPGEHLDFLVSK